MDSAPNPFFTFLEIRNMGVKACDEIDQWEFANPPKIGSLQVISSRKTIFIEVISRRYAPRNPRDDLIHRSMVYEAFSLCYLVSCLGSVAAKG